MPASSSRPITPRRAAGCERGIHTSGSNCPRVMASSGAGSVSGLAVSQPRPASARCSRIGENSASSGVSIQVMATSRGIGGRAQPGGGLDGQGVRQVRRQGDPQPRPSQACRLPGLADPVIDQGQHVPGGVQQHGARRGQPHPVAAAVQQRRAEDLFQPPDLLAEGRLGDEQPFRGAGEGARIGDRYEVPQVPQFKTLRRLCVRPGQPDRFCLCLLHVRHLCQAVVCLFFPCLHRAGCGTAECHPGGYDFSALVGMASQSCWRACEWRVASRASSVRLATPSFA